jgi:hypothetical protein
MRLKLLMSATLLLLAGETHVALSEEASDIPPAMQAALVTRIIEQEKTISAKPDIRIGIFCSDETACRELLYAFKKSSARGVKINKSPFEVRLLGKDELSDPGVDAIYIMADDPDIVGELIKTTRKNKILSIAGINAEAYVHAGISVGLTTVENRPKILVNITSVREEGREFQTRFMTLVKLYQ